jgi:hypothetical protein
MKIPKNKLILYRVMCWIYLASTVYGFLVIDSLRRQTVSLIRRLVSVNCPVRELVFALSKYNIKDTIVERLRSYGLSPVRTALGRSTLTTIHQEDGVVDSLRTLRPSSEYITVRQMHSVSREYV